ncbi:uncharacterized protein LOC124771285 [Schistocerca piceifrons]|uniref:uncharacterized protein LOC124771285 n=1 Tax=Schistocerca piceifrons TaxID=274613 RepID=UPI001F5F1B76|nr:uncharacterized protein LOC124771285 [Schistocerca piceifrons]
MEEELKRDDHSGETEGEADGGLREVSRTTAASGPPSPTRTTSESVARGRRTNVETSANGRRRARTLSLPRRRIEPPIPLAKEELAAAMAMLTPDEYFIAMQHLTTGTHTDRVESGKRAGRVNPSRSFADASKGKPAAHSERPRPLAGEAAPAPQPSQLPSPAAPPAVGEAGLPAPAAVGGVAARAGRSRHAAPLPTTGNFAKESNLPETAKEDTTELAALLRSLNQLMTQLPVLVGAVTAALQATAGRSQP